LRRVARYRLADAVVDTDARRWDRLGVLRTTLRNWTILAGAACGVPLERLARLYYGTRSDAEPPSIDATRPRNAD
jgi:hypothetical protein